MVIRLYDLNSRNELHIRTHTSPIASIIPKREQVPEKKWKYLFVLLAVRKRGKCGSAFKVTNDREHLGHLQTELSPLWSFNVKSTV